MLMSKIISTERQISAMTRLVGYMLLGVIGQELHKRMGS